jgi:hypothetical protein
MLVSLFPGIKGIYESINCMLHASSGTVLEKIWHCFMMHKYEEIIFSLFFVTVNKNFVCVYVCACLFVYQGYETDHSLPPSVKVKVV